MNSKIIFTMETPEDLYIIGDVPWELFRKPEYEPLMAKYDKRFVTITDDYMGVTVRSTKKSASSCETVGTFLLVTKSEWENEFLPVAKDLVEDYHDEPYAIVCKDYVGDVAIDIYSYGENPRSLLKEYDGKELMYQPEENYEDRTEEEKDDNGLHDYVVLLDTGFSTKPTMLRELYGYTKKSDVSYENIFLNLDTNEIFYGYPENDEELNFEEIGQRKTITEYWLKK